MTPAWAFMFTAALEGAPASAPRLAVGDAAVPDPAGSGVLLGDVQGLYGPTSLAYLAGRAGTAPG